MSSTSTKSKSVFSEVPSEDTFNIVGVDLSQKKFDTYHGGKLRTYPYNALGLKRFCTFLSHLKGRVVVAYESTGAISRPFTRKLIEMNIQWRCVPPFFVRSYATAMGINAKTDAKDAQIIAEYAQAKKPKETITITRKQLDLQEMEALKQFYIRQRANFKTALASYELPEAKACLQATIKALAMQIKQITEKIDKVISEDKELSARRALYVQESGIGEKIAQTLICTLPELGSCSGKEISSLVGLAPFDRSSGETNGPKHIRGGRKNVRTAMYMAGIAIRRCKRGEVKDFYRRLKAANKSNRVIAIACARKILIRLNAATRSMLQQLQTAS